MKHGIESLKAAVQKDAAEGNNCFNENGCDHEFHRTVPETNPAFIKMGFKTACKCVSKCTHKYCDTYKWTIDRAKHYAEKTGRTVDEILEAWESGRTYWYMNYYNEYNQPLEGRPAKNLDELKLTAEALKMDIETYEFLVTTLDKEHQLAAKTELISKVEGLKSNLKKTLSAIATNEIMCFSASTKTEC